MYVTVALVSRTVGKGMRDGADLLDEGEISKYRSLVGAARYLGQDIPEAQYATKEAARFLSGPTRAARCLLKRLCKYYSEVPVLSWSFPYQSMPTAVRAVTDANWAGELEALRSPSSGWIYFEYFDGDLLETYSSTQQIVALSTAESEYISITKGAAHALEVRSAVAEWGLSPKVVCETDASAGRAVTTRRGVGRVRLRGYTIAVVATVVRRRRGPNANQSWRAQRSRLGNENVDLRRMTSLSNADVTSTAGGMELMCDDGDSGNECGSKRPQSRLKRAGSSRS